MAREKGTGNLQREKSGRWTVRVGINGKRLSRSARTTDRDKAERFLNRFLAPLGLGAERLPLAEAWHHYEMSPNRRDIAKTTLNTKRSVWMGFARWVERNHVEITELAQVTEQAVGEYLSEFRCHHSASTYNNHVCVLREVFRLLADKAGLVDDPFSGVCLRTDDSVSRRELTLDEVERLYAAASKQGREWKLLVTIGIYTGLRLGDCCRLEWESVNLERRVIQLIPSKTKKHMHGRPVTIPIHPQLMEELLRAREYFSRVERGERVEVEGMGDLATKNTRDTKSATRDHENRACAATAGAVTIAGNPRLASATPASEDSPQSAFGSPHNPDTKSPCGLHENAPAGLHESSQLTHSSTPPLTHFLTPHSPYVNPVIAEMYINRNWSVDEGLRHIFQAANITMSVRMEGRSRRSVLASFHSLRHTFVSISANAGVPLPVVQSIVGHCSTAMTRHYYHENLDALRQAVEAIPAIGTTAARTPPVARGASEAANDPPRAPARREGVPARLRRLERYRAQGLVTEEEYKAHRERILAQV